MSFDWNASFEFLADRFYMETGYMAPGKDDPIPKGEDEEKERRRLWSEFMRERSAEAWAAWHEKYGEGAKQ